MNVLRARKDVDRKRVGLLGLSQGGWVAPLAAAKGRAAFVVDVSGAAVTPRQQLRHEVEQDLRRARLDTTAIARVLTLLDLGQSFALDRSPEAWTRYISDRSQLMAGPLEPIVRRSSSDSTDSYWTFWRLNGHLDPMKLWRSLDVPALVVYGAEDESDNVPVAESVRLLQASGFSDVNNRRTLQVFPGAGHALADTLTGGVRQDVLTLLARWARDAVAR
jgi:pimeloyl-ACP methyl ester carboxylesterase